MLVPRPELLTVLRQFNPWWSGNAISDLPTWHRAAFREIVSWLQAPPPRALLLSGARQIGKTTLLLQAVDQLLQQGVPPQRILYATFDHPFLKLAGLDELISSWHELEPPDGETEYLLLDEIQYARDWQTWLKLQVDFQKHRRIVVTGSATPLIEEKQESGVGRWHTVRLATLSFFEYLQIRRLRAPDLPGIASLTRLFSWEPRDFLRYGDEAQGLIGHFHEYLIRGGFPQPALVSSLPLAQKLLREDIVDKVLKRDMTAFFGVRRVMELEQTFLYLCLHDGGLLNMEDLSRNLAIKKSTAQSFIQLLEASHLIHKLPPFGYGKQVLRAHWKIYLADAALRSSVLMRGKGLLENATELGAAVETAFFKHVFTRYYDQSPTFSYWRGKGDAEVDIIADSGSRLVPFEVKYRNEPVTLRDIAGLRQFCEERSIARGYVITKHHLDFGLLPIGPDRIALKIPAPLACYWLGRSELEPGVGEP
ncbi:MAG: ATP-binding protein [Chloroflexota bacterium]